MTDDATTSTDSTTSSSTVPGLDDLLALLGLPNPLAGVGRTLDQFRRGTDELLTTMARFNETLDQLNGVARRVNGFLDDIEEPVKAAMPQVTRTVKAADVITQQLVTPIERLAPGLARLAEALAHPSINRLPAELVSVTDSLGELVRRLSPLTQMAESAGSLLGLRGLGALGGLVTRSSDPAPPEAPTPPAPASTASPKSASRTKSPRSTASAAPTQNAEKRASSTSTKSGKPPASTTRSARPRR